MLDLRRLDDRVSVAPQVAPEDMAELAAQGFALVINNRPDGEAPDQPPGAAIRAAANTAGLDYAEVPVGHGGFTQAQLTETIDLLSRARGPVLAYCRSGTRSCHVWALAQAGLGGDPEALVETAAAAGYDLTPLRPLLDSLSSRG